MGRSDVELRPIVDDDADDVAAFLHTHLNPGVPSDRWTALVRPPWASPDAPDNHGFQLVHREEGVVGVYLAVYSTRPSSAVPICNLAAFCVLEPYRQQAVRLIRALLAQRGYLFTDLSPSGQVPAINERLGFRHLDTATRLTVNLPGRRRGVRVDDSPAVLTHALAGRDADVYRDHRAAPGARHLLVTSGQGQAYLLYRRDRRKRLPVFASPLHVGGSRTVLEEAWPAVARHLLSRGLPLTLAEHRVLGFVPPGPGRELARPRPKMVRGAEDVADVDYLYSELTLLEW